MKTIGTIASGIVAWLALLISALNYQRSHPHLKIRTKMVPRLTRNKKYTHEMFAATLTNDRRMPVTIEALWLEIGPSTDRRALLPNATSIGSVVTDEYGALEVKLPVAVLPFQSVSITFDDWMSHADAVRRAESLYIRMGHGAEQRIKDMTLNQLRAMADQAVKEGIRFTRFGVAKLAPGGTGGYYTQHSAFH